MPRAAVLGSPISHSRSPDLHVAAYTVLGLDWEYSAIECTVEEFPEFVSRMGDDWRGLSLTMPLKEVVLQTFEDISDLARRTLSGNTVWRRSAEDGWHVTNTDVSGICESLREAGVRSIDSARILGAGATARSAAAAAWEMGAKSVTIHARRIAQAEEVRDLARGWGLTAHVQDLAPGPIDDDLVISTLPADAAGDWADYLARQGADSFLGRSPALLDASYHPWPTPLASVWADILPSAPVASGRDMLLWQAVEQVALMTGLVTDENRVAVVDAMFRALSTDVD